MSSPSDITAVPGYAVVDLETTGLDPRAGARIIEIGVVTLGPDRGVEDTWETLVDPGVAPGPTRIHGIDRAMLRGAPTFAEVSSELVQRLTGRIVVAHNARFDMSFLDAEFARIGLGWTRHALCTLQLARRRRLPRKLDACCAHFGIVNRGAHHALGDAMATVELLDKLDPHEREIPDPVRFARVPAAQTLWPVVKPRVAGPTRPGALT